MPIARPEVHLMVSGAAIYCTRVLSDTLKVRQSKPWLRSRGEERGCVFPPFDRGNAWCDPAAGWGRGLPTPPARKFRRKSRRASFRARDIIRGQPTDSVWLGL